MGTWDRSGLDMAGELVEPPGDLFWGVSRGCSRLERLVVEKREHSLEASKVRASFGNYRRSVEELTIQLLDF